MDSKLLKAQLLGDAFLAAVAGLQNVTMIDGVPVNYKSDISDPGQQKLNVLVYETAKVHYAAQLKALADNTVWPDPPASAAPSAQTPGALVAILTDVAKTATAGSPVASLATQLISALVSAGVQQVQSSAPAQPVPEPGSDIPAPAPSSPATPSQPTAAAK